MEIQRLFFAYGYTKTAPFAAVLVDGNLLMTGVKSNYIGIRACPDT
jgi:hypothetical protein